MKFPGTLILFIILLVRFIDVSAQTKITAKFNAGFPERVYSHSDIFGKQNGKVYVINRTTLAPKKVDYHFFLIQKYDATSLKLEKEMEIPFADFPGLEKEQVFPADQSFGKEYNAIVVGNRILMFFWDFYRSKDSHIEWKYLLFVKQFDLNTLAQIGTPKQLLESAVNVIVSA